MGMEDITGVVMEVDSERHGHSQRQGYQSRVVPGMQGWAHGDPQVRHGGHLGDREQVWQGLCWKRRPENPPTKEDTLAPSWSPFQEGREAEPSVPS